MLESGEKNAFFRQTRKPPGSAEGRLRNVNPLSRNYKLRQTRRKTAEAPMAYPVYVEVVRTAATK